MQTNRIIWLLACFFLISSNAWTELDSTDEAIIDTIIAEAANQGFEGMVGVAEVIRNRHEDLRGFRSRQRIDFKVFVARQPTWVRKQAVDAWSVSAETDFTHGATAFESSDFPQPEWSKRMVKTVTIKKHTFYRES